MFHLMSPGVITFISLSKNRDMKEIKHYDAAAVTVTVMVCWV